MKRLLTTQVTWTQIPTESCYVNLPVGSKILGWGSNDKTWLCHYITPDTDPHRPEECIALRCLQSGAVYPDDLGQLEHLATSDTFGPFHWHLFKEWGKTNGPL